MNTATLLRAFGTDAVDAFDCLSTLHPLTWWLVAVQIQIMVAVPNDTALKYR